MGSMPTVNILPQMDPTVSPHLSLYSGLYRPVGQSSHRPDHLYTPHLYTHLAQLYEYACMFTFEVRFIWAARWSLTKCLYLVTRYLQFFLIGAFIYQSMSSSSHLSFPKSHTQPIQSGH